MKFRNKVRARAKVNLYFLTILMLFVIFSFKEPIAFSEFKSIIYITSQGSIQYSKQKMLLHTEGRWLYNGIGELVHLRGVAHLGFHDSCAGWFPTGEYEDWDEAAMIRNLETLSGYGVNFVVCHCWYDWLNRDARDTLGGLTTNIGCRDAVKQFVAKAYEYGIYVGIDILEIDPSLRLDAAGRARWVASHKAEWINFWLMMSREFRGYPNIIYQFIEEPWGTKEEMDAYFQACVEAAQAVRAEGDEHIFSYHEGWCTYPILFDPDTGEAYRRLDQHVANVVYDAHIYRYHGTFGDKPDEFNPYRPGGLIDYDGVYRYEDVKEALEYYKYRKILDDYKVPIIAWEVGANTYSTTWSREIECFTNVLKILNEWQIGYAPSFWRNAERGEEWNLLDENYELTESGEVLMYRIGNSG